MDNVARSIAHCVNLQKCIWTRDGTLTSEILSTLHKTCRQLKDLEVNGHSSTYYDPTLLLRFSDLTGLSVIMPDRALVNVLPEWIMATGPTLKNISLSSPLIDDDMMKHIATHSTNLEQLHLIGTPRVTNAGVAAVVAGSPRLIKFSFDGDKIPIGKSTRNNGTNDPDPEPKAASKSGKGAQNLRSLSLEGVSPNFASL
ncbi:hypothetical protein FRB96_005991 [Tulasnella sp. 330]|nr:hypothetical protein FRB96_005991 [Tulasnella sp. 330]KAG8882143.1 hypothetical protein FRB97_008631 [Tulasnella sp. 331]KAG8887733.1 hypothetical protein FRB98_009117 [Tulasnella sp. 332]